MVCLRQKMTWGPALFSTVNDASNSSGVTVCHRFSCVTCLPNLKRVSLFKDSRVEKKRKVWDAVDDVTLKLKL